MTSSSALSSSVVFKAVRGLESFITELVFEVTIHSEIVLVCEGENIFVGDMPVVGMAKFSE